MVKGGAEYFDPICGKRVEQARATNMSVEYRRRRYFFCSEHCKHTFECQAEKLRIRELAKAGALFTPGRVRWGVS